MTIIHLFNVNTLSFFQCHVHIYSSIHIFVVIFLAKCLYNTSYKKQLTDYHMKFQHVQLLISILFFSLYLTIFSPSVTPSTLPFPQQPVVISACCMPPNPSIILMHSALIHGPSSVDANVPPLLACCGLSMSP